MKANKTDHERLNTLINALIHLHECHCGTATHTPHETGTCGCKRFITDDVVFAWAPGEWFVNGAIVSEYTLYHQRGFYQHPCGCWSRWSSSINSLDA